VKIFYGICGEGLGHSGRSLALIERLVALGHTVTIFTFAHAYRLLDATGFQPHLIEGLCWRENGRGGVSPAGTCCNLGHYLRTRRRSLDDIRQLALAQRPDLFITDFEPLTALAADSLKIPCVSVDNQHRFCEPLGSGFPRSLEWYGWMAGQFVRRWIKGPRQCIVAVFHDCPPNRHFRRVDALVRDCIARVEPTDGEHVLVYGRSEIGRRMAEVAATVPARFIAYGCDGPSAANIEYKRASYDEFAADLASSRAVVALAGHQIISEARYFGKPLLVVPMPNQHEQAINAHYARRGGLADYVTLDRLSAEDFHKVLQRGICRMRPANGIAETLDLIGIGHG
jgi:uncharacterized protein (TIGR00661 family)